MYNMKVQFLMFEIGSNLLILNTFISARKVNIHSHIIIQYLMCEKILLNRNRQNEGIQIQNNEEDDQLPDNLFMTLEQSDFSRNHQQYRNNPGNNLTQFIQLQIQSLENLLQCFLIETLTQKRMKIIEQQYTNNIVLKVYFLPQAFLYYQLLKNQLIQTSEENYLQQNSYLPFSLKTIFERNLTDNRTKISKFFRTFFQLQGQYYLARVHSKNKIIIDDMITQINRTSQLYGMNATFLGEDDYLFTFREEIIGSLRVKSMGKKVFGLFLIISNKLLIIPARIRNKQLLFNQLILNKRLLSKVEIRKHKWQNQNQSDTIYSFTFHHLQEATDFIKFVYLLGEKACLQYQTNKVSSSDDSGFKSDLQDIFHLCQQGVNNCQSHIIQVGINDQQQLLEQYWENRMQDQSDSDKLQKIIKVFQNESIIAWTSYWDQGLLKYLQKFNQDEYYLNETLYQLVRLIQFKMMEFIVNLRTLVKQDVTFYRQKQKGINLIQILYPGTQNFIQRYLTKNKFMTFWNVYDQFKETYERKAKNSSVDSTNNNSISQFDQQKIHKKIEKQCFKQFITSYKKCLSIQENSQDNMVIKHIQQLIAGQVQGNFSVRLQGNVIKPLQRHIYENCSKENAATLQKVLIIIDSAFEEIAPLSKQKLQQRQRKISYLANIENERLSETRCLGCTKFLYKNMNILDDSSDHCPVKTFSSIKKIREEQPQLKQQICAMLNGNGGVILFGCSAQNRSIIVKGQTISEQMKYNYIQSLQYIIRGFFPKISFKKNVGLSFVPVKQNPYNQTISNPVIKRYTGEQYLIKGEETYIERNYIPGLYVARIRVSPPTLYQTFMWKSSEESYYCFIYEDGKTKEMKGKSMIKFFKRKLNRLWKQSNEPDNPNYHHCLRLAIDCCNGKCLQPQHGNPVGEVDDLNQSPREANQVRYKHMSRLIIKSENIPILKSKLKERNVEVQIEVRFSRCEFKGIKGTAILYHNISFLDLLYLFESKDFEIDGKKLILIYVTEYLQFASREQFQYFKKNEQAVANALIWLNREFPGQQIRYYEYDTQQGKKYYMETDSKLSMVYVFYLFNHYKIRLCFKSPSALNTLSSQEKNQRWRELQMRDNFKTGFF